MNKLECGMSIELMKKYDDIRTNMGERKKLVEENTAKALAFLIEHFDTVKSHRVVITRSSLRKHIFDIFNEEYGAGNYDSNAIGDFLNKKFHFTSRVYFFTSVFLMVLVCFLLFHFQGVESIAYIMFIFVVGTLSMTALLDLAK